MIPFNPHPAAACFPMMAPDRLAELAESIKAHGLQVTILLWEGKILDGRNRHRACEMAGVKPRYEQWTGGNPFEHVWALNGQRRDIDHGTRCMVRLDVDEKSGAWQADQDRRAEAANEARSVATKELVKAKPRGEDGRLKSPGALSPDKRPGAKSTDHAHKALATAAGVSPATAARCIALKKKRPDLAKAVKEQTISLAEASRQAKKEEVAGTVEEFPSDKFRVLYADPPWKYGDSRAGIETGYVPAENHYPTMSVADLCALDVRSLSEDNAVLFCWATFPLLPDCLEVVKAWGFTYKTSFVWSKSRANFGHYHTADAELLMVCTRGSCLPDADKRERQVQVVEHPGRHSEKPEAFRQLIDRQYLHGRRLELFRRGEAPAGWRVWGNEVVNAEA